MASAEYLYPSDVDSDDGYGSDQFSDGSDADDGTYGFMSTRRPATRTPPPNYSSTTSLPSYTATGMCIVWAIFPISGRVSRTFVGLPEEAALLQRKDRPVVPNLWANLRFCTQSARCAFWVALVIPLRNLGACQRVFASRHLSALRGIAAGGRSKHGGISFATSRPPFLST